MTARNQQDSNPGSHNCEPNAIPLSYPTTGFKPGHITEELETKELQILFCWWHRANPGLETVSFQIDERGRSVFRPENFCDICLPEKYGCLQE